MKKSTLALAWVLLAIACDEGNSSGGRDGGTPRDGGSQTAELDCADLVACVDACSLQACTNACLASASDVAVTQITALVNCSESAGCGEDDACIAANCSAEVATCGLSYTPADGGTPGDGGTSDAFPARITGTTRDHNATIGLDSNATVAFVRDDAAGAAAGYPTDLLAFYRLESIDYRATWSYSAGGCTTNADESESFTDPPALENYLMIEREVGQDGLHGYHFATGLTVSHPAGLVTVCPGVGTTTGTFNAEHYVTNGTTTPRTDLATFDGTSSLGGVREITWDLQAAD